MSTDLGRKIQYLRLQSKESQEVMAQKVNISRQAISKWENNVSVPDVAMLSKIANYYDVEITYFTNDENSNDSSKKQMKSLFFLDTQLYRFVLGFVSVLTLLFFSVFSLLLTIPLFYINLTRKKIRLVCVLLRIGSFRNLYLDDDSLSRINAIQP